MRAYRDDQKFVNFRINILIWGIVMVFVFLALTLNVIGIDTGVCAGVTAGLVFGVVAFLRRVIVGSCSTHEIVSKYGDGFLIGLVEGLLFGLGVAVLRRMIGKRRQAD